MKSESTKVLVEALEQGRKHLDIVSQLAEICACDEAINPAAYDSLLDGIEAYSQTIEETIATLISEDDTTTK